MSPTLFFCSIVITSLVIVKHSHKQFPPPHFLSLCNDESTVSSLLAHLIKQAAERVTSPCCNICLAVTSIFVPMLNHSARSFSSFLIHSRPFKLFPSPLCYDPSFSFNLSLSLFRSISLSESVVHMTFLWGFKAGWCDERWFSRV